MNWEGQRESDNVENEDSSDGGGGGFGGRHIAFGGGLGTVVIIVICLLLGKNPAQLLNGLQQGPAPVTQHVQVDTADRTHKFVRTVLGETEDVWTELFKQMGKQYVRPHLKLFRDEVQSGCGDAQSATGPFYCPGDQKVYLDLSFFDEMRNRFQVDADFANAYVIAHEVGHHVQNLLGTSEKVSELQARSSKVEANKLSVKLELQADFFAGVWANHAQKMRNILQNGDIDAALKAATAIGDDKLQMQAQGYVRPDAFTHGTSAQRVYWFKKGFETGDVSQGDTFGSDTD